ncbi:hypothetical protein BD626DRAFT_564455 [Schizophyllum amplum]|uniref:Uncharacterized protein n=1 Tax=Schizophyllum amplum TaxID=97359 RepID=A0A550CRW1_9AGAR|nr:hypothetical protein BD626DRAFT_564455 [Auriculariopsis ampla]
MALQELAILFLLVPPATASPIDIRSPTGSACLAIFLTLFLLLSLLVACKIFYAAGRQRSSPRYDSSMTSEKTDWSASTIQPLGKISSQWTDDSKGFFVGLFGSPSWETRAKAIEERARIFCRSFDSRSLRSSRRSTRYGGSVRTVEKYPCGDTEKHGSLIVDNRVLYTLDISSPPSLAHSLRLPTVPSRPKNPSPILRSSSRFSLADLAPFKNKADPSDAISHRQRRSRSRASWKSWISDTSGAGSIRLVGREEVPELPLLLSPDPQNRKSVDTQWSAESKPRNSRYSFTIPKVPMPSAVASPLFGPTPSGVDELGHRLSAMDISHPYALTACPKRHSQSGPAATPTTLAPHTPQCRSPSAPDHPFTSLDVVMTSQSNQPAKSSSPPTTPDLSSFPSPPTSVVPTPKLKSALKKRNPSTRSSRRSPPVGPSPLRIMTLPGSDSAGRLQKRVSEHISEEAFYAGLPQAYQGIGLGHPSTSMGYARSRASSLATQDDPAALLGMIRELADEASAWDPDLFVNDNFRAMLQVAGEVDKSAIDSEQSVEMDLSMLGVEIVSEDQGDSSSGSDGTTAPGHGSFWEEKGSAVGKGTPGTIGRAC